LKVLKIAEADFLHNISATEVKYDSKITPFKSTCKRWLFFLHGTINQALNFTSKKQSSQESLPGTTVLQ
jgi:hypothetical protein